MIDLNEEAAGHALTTRIGQRVRVTLSENGTTGYRWQVAGNCNPFLKLESDHATTPAGPPGSGGVRVWIFAAIAEGACELRFEYARPWEKTVTGKVLTFPITVQREH